MAPHGLDCLHEMLASPLSPQLHHRQHRQQQQHQQHHQAWLASRGGRVAETATSAALLSPTQEGPPVLTQRLTSSSSSSSSSTSSSQHLSLSVSSPSSFSLSADRAMLYNGVRSRGSMDGNSGGLTRHPHHSSSTRSFGAGRGSEASRSNLLGPDLESVVPGDFISDSGNGLSSTRPPPAPHALSIDTSEALSSLSSFDSNGRARRPSTVYLNRWETKQQQQQYQYSHQRLSLLSEVSRDNKPMGALEVIVKAVEQPTYDDLGSSTFTFPLSPALSADPHSTSGNSLSSPLGNTGFFSIGSLRHIKASSASSLASSSSSAAQFTAPSSSHENLQRGAGSVFSTASSAASQSSPSSSSVISLLETSGGAGSFLNSQFSSMPPIAYPSEPSLMYARRSEEFLSPPGLSSHPHHGLTSREYQQAISLASPTASPTPISPLASHPNFLGRGNLLQTPRIASLSAEALSELRHQQHLQQQQQQQQQLKQQRNICDKTFSGNTIDFTGNYTIINNNNSLMAPGSLSKDISGDHAIKSTNSGGGGDCGLTQSVSEDGSAMPMWVWEIRDTSGGSAIYRPDLLSASGRNAPVAGNAGNLLRHSVESSSSDEVLGIVTHSSSGLPTTSGPSGTIGRHPDFREDGENKQALSIGQLIGGAMKIEPGDWMDFPDQQ